LHYSSEQHIAALMADAEAAIARMRLGPVPLAELQQHRLRRLLAHARQHSAFHRERLTHVEPDSFRLDDLDQLPTMTKRDLMTRFDDVMTERRLTRALVDKHVATAPLELDYLLGEYVVMASGGSSGERGLFVYRHDEFTEFTLTLLRPTLARLRAIGVSAERPITGALVAAPATVHGTGAVGALTGGAGSPVRITRLSAAQPLPEIVAALNTLQPMLLAGYPSVLIQLAYAQSTGQLRIRPLAVNATSEALSAEASLAIEHAFGVAPSNTFGSSEGLCGVGVPPDAGICFASDACIVELVDADHRPVAPGCVAAKVLVTNLYNFTQPLIRYELTDRFVALSGPFPDGHLRAEVDGRHDEPFRYHAAIVHPLAIREAMVRTAAVLEYQVLQRPDGIAARVVATAGFDERDLCERLTQALRAAGLAAPCVAVEVVDSIARDPVTGKARRFVPLASR